MENVYHAGDGTAIAYEAHGEGDRYALLIHGWMTSGLVYKRLTPALVEAGFHVIVPDLRGAGASQESKSDYSLATYAADMVSLLEHLEIERCVVVGHSMGGQVAQLLALEAPERVEAQALLCTVPASGLPLPDDALGLFRSASGTLKRSPPSSPSRPLTWMSVTRRSLLRAP